MHIGFSGMNLDIEMKNAVKIIRNVCKLKTRLDANGIGKKKLEIELKRT